MSAADQAKDSNERTFFRSRDNIVAARAPGRLDVMGGIADYSGSMVLQMPTQESTTAFVELTDEASISLVSIGSGDRNTVRKFRLAASQVDDNLHQPDAYWLNFFRNQKSEWAAYVIGCLILLLRQQERACPGCRILISSDVPEGKGVSSSAALEIASMLSLSSAMGLDLDRKTMAFMAQHVENNIAGAPCGIMDQMAVTFGRERQLMALLCQPAELNGYVSLPADLAVWGLDSGVRHSVSGADYTDVRAAAFMGLQILRDILPGDQVDHLANINPEMFRASASRLPESLTGKEFLEKYGALVDDVSQLDPQVSYPVRVAAAHPVFEHARITEWIEVLQKGDKKGWPRLGELMYESHESYSVCGLGSDGTDMLVSLVKRQEKAGLFGARISGGGSGGTVVVLGQRDAYPAIEAVCREYEQATGYQPYVFSGSSPGAELLQ